MLWNWLHFLNLPSQYWSNHALDASVKNNVSFFPIECCKHKSIFKCLLYFDHDVLVLSFWAVCTACCCHRKCVFFLVHKTWSPPNQNDIYILSRGLYVSEVTGGGTSRGIPSNVEWPSDSKMLQNNRAFHSVAFQWRAGVTFLLRLLMLLIKSWR